MRRLWLPLVILSTLPLGAAFPEQGILVWGSGGTEPVWAGQPAADDWEERLARSIPSPEDVIVARSTRGVAATLNEAATRVAVDVLEAGGNAMDAAAATWLVLSVVSPNQTGLGGGGYILYREAGSDQTYLVDAYVRAAMAAPPAVFLDDEGEPLANEEIRARGLAVGVSGLVRGFDVALKRWGTRYFDELVAPAVRLDEDRLLFTSIREDGQADIYLFSLLDEELVRLTETPESEYSPQAAPGRDGFSVVRVEEDGVSQRLYLYPFDGGAPTLLLPELDDVGYHAWVSEEKVAVFRVGEPSSLCVADLRTGDVEHVQDHVGRSLQSIPGSESSSFIHRSDDEGWLLQVLDGSTGQVSTVGETLPGREDHAWMSSETVLMGHEGVLHRLAAGRSREWIPLVDLGPFIGDFSRIAVSPSGLRIAVVVARGP